MPVIDGNVGCFHILDSIDVGITVDAGELGLDLGGLIAGVPVVSIFICELMLLWIRLLWLVRIILDP